MWQLDAVLQWRGEPSAGERFPLAAEDGPRSMFTES